jgi:leucyl aminopeptidase
MLQIQFTSKAASGKAKDASALVVGVSQSLALGAAATALDSKAKGAIARALKASSFEGKVGQIEQLLGVDGLIAGRIVIVGLGDAKKLDAMAYQKAGGALYGALHEAKITHAEIHLDAAKESKLSLSEAAAHLAYGVRLRAYHFIKYHTTRKDELKAHLQSLHCVVKDEKTAKATFAPLLAVAEGVDVARNLVSEPANVIYPDSYAKQCKQLEKLGVKVEVLGEAQMKKLGMGSLLGVGQGSVHESKLVVMQWLGGKKADAPVAFVGKGVTFDTGGISIKPSLNMHDMKYDMAGSAAVVGLMHALAARKAKVNAIGVIGLVENMPDGNAIKPGDVLTSMSGQTIEVLNTDAEGRLVLADALWYTQDRFNPRYMVDLATLTGAIVVTLGDSRAGLFSNDDGLSEQLSKAGSAVEEHLWRLPLGEEYDKQINSDIADMQNIGRERQAGSITAAQFLQRFVNKTPWAHLDIAGVAWSGKGGGAGPKGATAFGVRLLNQFVAQHCENA